MAGTGAFFTGSIFIAIVPPVAISLTTGGAAAAKFTQKKTVTSKQTAIHEDLRIIPSFLSVDEV
jgi:hypothetical protein